MARQEPLAEAALAQHDLEDLLALIEGLALHDVEERRERRLLTARDGLVELGGMGADVRVSYDDRSTRG